MSIFVSSLGRSKRGGPRRTGPDTGAPRHVRRAIKQRYACERTARSVRTPLAPSASLRCAVGLVVAISAVVWPRRAPAVDTIRFQTNQNQVVVQCGKRPLATYVFRDAAIPRPYFAHVHAPNGQQVTRHHPPRAGRDATDHATFHPGIWMAFGDINGHDYWRLKARVEHVAFVDAPRSEAGRGSFSVRNRYWSESGKEVVCSEVARYTFQIIPAGYLVHWDSTFSSSAGEFSFGDQEEMGLGIRVATPIAVTNGGQIRNRDGQINEKQAWGKMSDWCDYSGTTAGFRIGMTLMPAPENFRRCWYHARDYGFCAANPFGRNAFTGGKKSKIKVAAGTSLRLRFGILLHAQPETKPKQNLGQAYRAYLDQLNSLRRSNPDDK